jgi:hypothetical protein
MLESNLNLRPFCNNALGTARNDENSRGRLMTGKSVSSSGLLKNSAIRVREKRIITTPIPPKPMDSEFNWRR